MKCNAEVVNTPPLSPPLHHLLLDFAVSAAIQTTGITVVDVFQHCLFYRVQFSGEGGNSHIHTASKCGCVSSSCALALGGALDSLQTCLTYEVLRVNLSPLFQFPDSNAGGRSEFLQRSKWDSGL